MNISTTAEWDADQQSLRESAEKWADGFSAGHELRDAEATFPSQTWGAVRDSGILRLPFPEAHGGVGQSLLTTMYVLEGLGYRCRDAGLSFSISTHMVSTGVPLQRFGSPDLKQRYLPAICDGDLIGAHAISEPEAGSDAMRMRTVAVRDGDHFILNGSKAFVSNGPVAGLFVVYARTGPAGTPAALSAFLVPRTTPGLSVGQPISKMGLRSSPLSELFFDDCRVPASHLVGREGAGFLVLDYVLRWEILCSFAITLGEMTARLDRCVNQAQSRHQFGRPIGDFQAISHKIADMKIATETARLWLYRTGQLMSQGKNVTADVAITKIVVSEANVATALAAVQVFGGYGYMTEYGLERDLRNAVGGTLYSGTSEVQRNRIATLIGL